MENRLKTITLRRLIETDIPAFREIRLEALENHPEYFGSSFDEEKSHAEVYFSDRIKNNTIIGCFDKNELIGIIGISRSNMIKTQHIASIWGMYVRPKARGLSMSKALLNQAIKEMKVHCRSIRLSVVSTNIVAIKLYESVGFRTWAIDTEALKIGNNYYDEVLMRYDIQSEN